MKPTIESLKESFAKYNKMYFGGSLREPTFEISNSKSHLGRYHSLNKKIEVSIYYDREERDYDCTLIHEMIHLWQHENGMRLGHGASFKKMANEINRRGGWNISRLSCVKGCGTNVEKTYNIAVFQNGNGKYFLFAVNPNYVLSYKRRFRERKHWYKDAFMFESNDGKKYAHLPLCRTSVRGEYITKEEYENLKRCA